MPLTAVDNALMTRDEVRTVQRRLIVHGYDPGPVDGILGPRTLAAIMAFKRAAGLVTRPWVGPLTWDRLMRDPVAQASPLPPWVQQGLRIRGWHERTDNAELRAWLGSDGHALGDPALVPWCGDFVETSIRLALPGEPIPAEPYWALHWRGFGVACRPCVGAVVSITREGGGHVGFAVGRDETRIYVLGGNQSNAVSIAPIAASRFEGDSWRWPRTWTGPQTPLPAMTSAEAAAVNFA